jgi:hypothetical protein
MRKSGRLIDLLEKLLGPFGAAIDSAYLFESPAKSDQPNATGDIDILIIGSVQMRDLESTMGYVERTLRRPVNATYYSRADFEQRMAKGNPFLRSLIQEERTFITGTTDLLSAAANQPAKSPLSFFRRSSG